jgi:hypothetical protein
MRAIQSGQKGQPRGDVEMDGTLPYLYPTADGQEITDMTLPGVKP